MFVFINTLGVALFCDWIYVFKVARGASYESQSVIEATASAGQNNQIFLSRRENSDYVASIQPKTGVNNNLDDGILQGMMPDGTHLTHADTTGSEKMLYRDIQHLIMQGNTFNDEDELSLIYDMYQFNIRVNNGTR